MVLATDDGIVLARVMVYLSYLLKGEGGVTV